MNNPFETNPYQSPSSASTALPDVGNRSYGGIRRMAYFGYSFLASIVYQLAIFGAAAALGGGGNAQAGMLIGFTIIALLAYLGASFYIIGQRLINIGTNPWWSLLMIVPIANIFIGVRCLICPEGYSDHKTLDTPAKVIFGIIITIIVLVVIALVVGVAVG